MPVGAPAGLPGAGGGGAMPSGFMGMPGASFMPPMAFPSTDPAEIEKRIADLRSVEGWLALNLEIVRTTIQGFEAQKATIAAFHAMQTSMSESFKAQADQVASTARGAAEHAARASRASADHGAPPAPSRPRKKKAS